ncbi:hypothetical protein [Pseudochryseolinea flava]|nr:hypothetical protein [Pseudochryseolinea flava]
MTVKRVLWIIVCVAWVNVAQSQSLVKASAIHYQVEIDIRKFDPANGKALPDPIIKFETDAYYSDSHVRTFNRRVKSVEDYDLTLRQRLYDQASTSEYNVDHEAKFMVLKEAHVYKPKSTGKKKTILNYACKEYTVTDFQGRQLSFWVTDKLGKNVSPWGNFQIEGTALEITSSFGVHFIAAEFATGEVDGHFFDVPSDYQIDKIPFPTKAK